MSTLRRLLPLLASFAISACAHAASVGWSWTGGVTDTSAVVTARIDGPSAARLEIPGSDLVVSSTLSEPLPVGTLHRFTLSGLKPDTEYRFRFVSADNTPVDTEPRSFRTFPEAGKPANFRFAVASCAKGMNSPVFAAAARQGARFFVHTGDFHYYDIAENRVEAFRRAYDTHLSAPRLRAMLATVPLIYQWDDHDFGPNDSNRTSPSREASRQNYRELVPHYPLSVITPPDAQSGPTDQAFSVGRVRFILSDLRSERDPVGRRMMSAAQDAWLRAQLIAARDTGHAMIFWVSSVPWNGAPLEVDRWQGYTKHRTEIADFIKANGLAGKVAILSGDAHMTAIDDGKNSDFATGGGAPVPIFQAGPIANRGSYKGGPYSHGARFQSAPDQLINQFGLVDIHDDGKTLRVTWSGRSGADGLGDQILLSERDAEGPIRLEFTAQ